MSQEMNKKAMDALFCLEDSKVVCEAIGGLGLDAANKPTDDPLEYTPDNILDVVVNDNPDGMPAFPQVGQQEMDDETKAFVVDQLAQKLQADGRETINADDLTPFAVVIKGENNIPQDLVSFTDQIISGNNARLASQNVSEALPNGVTADLTNGGAGGEEVPPPAPAAPGAPESVDPNAAPAAPGAETLPPAPGGLENPTDAPALTTNPDDGLGIGATGEPAGEGGDEFNLDVPEPGGEVPPAGDGEFTLDVGDDALPPAGDTTDTVGELNFEDGDGDAQAPAGDGEPASSEDALFSTLDSMSDEKLDGADGGDGSEPKGDETGASDSPKDDDKGGDKKDDEKPAETEAAAAPVTECGAAPAEPTPAVECGAAPAPETEPTVTEAAAPNPIDPDLDAKLESIKNNYIEAVAADRVRAVVESFQRKRDDADKQALCESIIANYMASQEAAEQKAQLESVTMAEKIGELGEKVVGLYGAKTDLDAKLESILDGYMAAKAKEDESKALDAKLESIVNDYVNANVDKAPEPEPAPAVVESAKVPEKSALDAKLESIIAETKAKMAAAK